jgi:maltooligosyltrehalose synthase
VPLEVEVEPPADIVAFAREHEGRGLLVAAPRFVTGLVRENGALPLGPVWRRARVLLRPEWSGRQIRNVLTGESVRPEVIDGRWSLLARDLLAHCPVALLVLG